MRTALVVAVTLLLVSACGGSDEAPSLDGSAWTLASLNGVEPLADAPATIAFEGEQVSGSTGCNQYSGTYTVEDGSLTFGPLASTRRGCPDEIMAQEAAYLGALESATGYTREEGTLEIAYPDGTLTFSAA